jgi:hypothetical protein
MLNFNPESDFVDLDLFADEDLADVEFGFSGRKPQDPLITKIDRLAAPSDLSGDPGDPGDHHAQFEKCLKDLSDVFPDICSDYVRNLFDTWMRVPRSIQDLDPIHDACHDLTVQILDASSYPKEKDRINELKRKRSDALDSDEEEELLWKAARNEELMESYMDAAYVSASLFAFLTGPT